MDIESYLLFYLAYKNEYKGIVFRISGSYTSLEYKLKSIYLLCQNNLNNKRWQQKHFLALRLNMANFRIYCLRTQIMATSFVTQQVLSKVGIVWIDAVCKTYSLDPDKIAVIAPNGHVLIDSSLALLFVSYIDTEFCVYVYERMADLLISGIILSDTTLALMAKDRLTKEVLLNLIDK